VSAPLLLECDLNGQIVWMSDQTRTTLGEAGNVSAAITAFPDYSYATLHFTRIWTAQDRLLLSGEISATEPDAVGTTLLRVQSDFLRHFFELQRMERSLYTRTRRLRRSGGSATIRQLELERQRLGRELHTGVGQLLAAIRMQLEVIAAQLPAPSPLVQQALTHISHLAADALDHVRTVSKRLHPPEWQRLTLEEALRQLWEASGVPQRFEAALELHPLAQEPALEVKILLYRAAQEALSNLMRHARATRVTITLEARESGVALVVRDDGVGFDVAALLAAPASIAGGIGLRSIRDQALAVGGKLQIESGPSGTKLEVTAPYLPADVLN
jgi:signal transduction histidine kinase